MRLRRLPGRGLWPTIRTIRILDGEESMAVSGEGRLSMRGCACCNDTLTLYGTLSSRRQVLRAGVSGGLALGGLSIGAFAATGTQAQEASEKKIPIVDVHHHLAAPIYKEELLRRKIEQRPMRDWTPEKSLADMDA